MTLKSSHFAQDEIERWIELSKLSLASYSSPINQKNLSYLGVAFTNQDIVHGSLGRGFCRVMWNINTTVIVFRGTREKIDWSLSNFRCFPAPLATNTEVGPLIHRGFQQALYYSDKSTKVPSFSAVLDRVETLASRGGDIVITGHSLGGAIATIFATRLAIDRPDLRSRIQVVTFGAPAVGFRKFKVLFDQLGFPLTRIVNAKDGVPFTPPLFYRHVGRECWISADGIQVDAGWYRRLPIALATPFSMSYDHDMVQYVVALYAQAAKPLPRSIIKRLRREREARAASVL